jgi:hemerythrin-like domain-containing protein
MPRNPSDPSANDERRNLLLTIAGASLLLGGCAKEGPAAADPKNAPGASARQAPESESAARPKAGEVTAVEDLMREHGVIRRVLIAYREAAARLRAKPASVPLDALRSAAQLIRTFAEDYHEKALEEAYLFPRVRDGAPGLAPTVSTLIAQHQRGREVTDYVIATAQGAPARLAAEPLARALDAFARMYDEHSAIEDTVVFLAWKKLLTPHELDEMGERFEQIEHQTFGKDGFDDAVERVSAIERALGIELGDMTAPRPPRA